MKDKRSKGTNIYKIVDDYAILSLPNSKENRMMDCLVDLDTLDRLIKLDRHWSVQKHNGGYYAGRTFCFNGKKMYVGMHRYIMGTINYGSNYVVVDHIDHDGLNNRKYNLRIATNSINCLHHSNHKIGASWRRDSRIWRARITINYKQINIGHYDTKEEALKAAADYRDKVIKDYVSQI